VPYYTSCLFSSFRTPSPTVRFFRAEFTLGLW